MPTYEYECQKCEHRFERFQSITAAPVQRCPQCKGKVKRLLGTGAGVIFKGSGFYQTDYRSEGYKKAAKTESSNSSSSKKEASKPKSTQAD
jgi:putative FmdB family regulatory protein